MGNFKFNVTALYILFTIVALGSLTGCLKQAKPVIDIKNIQSYRDIPGITDEEITAIEKIISERQSFSYGLLLSEDALELSGNNHPGFSHFFCGLLSDLFGVPFIPLFNDWQELKENVDSFAVDFTGTINATTDVENRYFKTSPIIGNKLSVFVKEGAIDIHSEYDLRGKRIGFFKDSYSERIFRTNFPRIDFLSAAVNTSREMADMLESGGIDAFVYDAPDVFEFYEYPHVIKIKTFPYIYVPVSVSTANPELRPVISAITKYLMAGGINEVANLNAIGEIEYASYIIKYSLSDEERAYIDALNKNGEKIPAGFTYNRYPVAFYSENDKQYQGIAKDVLDEISLLTGIEFEIAHDKSTGWVQLETMLKTGEIKLLSQLIPNEARREYAIWPDTHYFTARYALLSNLSYPYLSMNQVPYVRVGLPAGTAEEAVYKLWFPDAEYITFRTTDDGLTALEKGEIDLYFCLDYTLLYESNFRENAGQKVNILFNDIIEVVPFGLNKDEVILCSIISKAQRKINTDRIVRSWTSRVFDLSSQMAKERILYLTITIFCLLALLAVMLLSIVISLRLRKTAVESRINLQALLDMLPVGVRILSLDDWTLLYSNRACLEVFGCTSFEEQVQGRSGLGFMPEYQPDGRKTTDLMAELLKTDTMASEFQCYKLNGELFTCRMTSRTIKYTANNGRIHRASLGVMEDVTAEEEHIKMLENTALKEQEANQLKSRFLAMMSHEIRTPMNAILGITEIQLQNESLPEEAEEALGRIYESGNLLLYIINDILDLSKIEAGKLEILPVKYDLPSLVNDAIQINRLRYDSKPIEFRLDIDENTPLNLYGDELRIKQLLNNVISNAFKYTDKGTVTLSVSSEANSGNKDEVIMIFRITDTGYGMTQDQINKLFDEYTRFNMDNNRTVSGTGLGMSITKKILDLMNGEISVHSEPGKGTEFVIRLPQKRLDSLVCGKETSEKLKDFSFRSTLMSKKGHIMREYMPYGNVLVVDDVETNLYVTRGMLLPYGLKVDTAISGFDAIEKIKAGNNYDIIFMDHMMPKMDGIEAVKIIREWEKQLTVNSEQLAVNNGQPSPVPIIALTANAIVGQTEIFLENGFNGYISKPIDSRELNQILNEFVRNRKPPEVVKAARREQREKLSKSATDSQKQAEYLSTLDASHAMNMSEVKKFFVMDAESTIAVLENIMNDSFSNKTGKADIDSEKLNSFEIAVHGIKSALANIGEQGLSAAALKLEKASMEKNFSEIVKETPVFIESIKELVKKITFNPESDDRTAGSLYLSKEDSNVLLAALGKIKTACQTLDSNAARDIMDDIKQNIWPDLSKGPHSRQIDDILDEINVYLLHSAFQKAVNAVETAMEMIAK